MLVKGATSEYGVFRSIMNILETAPWNTNWMGLPYLTHLPPGPNGHHFAEDILKCIFLDEKFCIFVNISLNFVPDGPIDNNPALV